MPAKKVWRGLQQIIGRIKVHRMHGLRRMKKMGCLIQGGFDGKSSRVYPSFMTL